MKDHLTGEELTLLVLCKIKVIVVHAGPSRRLQHLKPQTTFKLESISSYQLSNSLIAQLMSIKTLAVTVVLLCTQWPTQIRIRSNQLIIILTKAFSTAFVDTMKIKALFQQIVSLYCQVSRPI